MSLSVKLAIGAGVIVIATAYMGYVGASASWKYDVTTDERLSRADTLLNSRIRLSGPVIAGSLRIAADRRQASFGLQGAAGQLSVPYRGAQLDLAVDCPAGAGDVRQPRPLAPHVSGAQKASLLESRGEA